MDAVAVMQTLLSAHEPLVDLVGDRIKAGTVSLNDRLPAIGLKEISRVEAETVARGSRPLVTARIQVTVYANSYPQQKALLAASGLGPGVYTGIMAGVNVRSVIRDAAGPDMGDHEAGIYEQSRDFKVTYVEPV